MRVANRGFYRSNISLYKRGTYYYAMRERKSRPGTIVVPGLSYLFRGNAHCRPSAE